VLPNVTLAADLKDGEELVTASGEVLTVSKLTGLVSSWGLVVRLGVCL